MLQTFHHLAPLLQVDKGLSLEPNPAAAKKQRRHQDTEPRSQGSPKGQSKGTQLDPTQILQMMGRLLLRVDRDLQVLQRETTFIFYFSCKDPKGILPLLLQKAEQWHTQAKEGSSSSMGPLRQVLLQTVIAEMANRINRLLEAPADSPLLQAAVQTQILLEDKKIPYMQWNQQDKKLQVSTKTPVSLAKMSEHFTELQEGFRDVGLIQKFHALPTKADSPVTPWRLQMSMREDRTYELMQHLAQSQVWTLLAASLKQHNLHQSALAGTLEKSLGFQSQKGQGKGPHKGKSQKMQSPKKEL